jgi:hypothetical protein
MVPKSPAVRAERFAAAIIALLLVIVLVAQTRTLYIFPQSDGARWWGDETGQMLELRAELHDGFARIPTGLGSSVAITNGLIRGNSWFAAAIYGLPVLLFSNVTDIVSIGRSITLALSIALLLAMYRMMRAQQVPRVLALFSLLILLSSRSFFYASHAARLDVAAGLGVIGIVWYLSARYDELAQMKWKPTWLWYFGYGAVVVLFATLSIHLLTLLGALSLYMLWRFGAFRKIPAIASVVGGAVLMLAVLLSIYAMSGAPFSLYGPSTAPNQFQSVASELPILRPFSRSVQFANILERFHGLWNEAPVFVVLAIVAIILRSAVRTPFQRSNRDKWISSAAIVICVAWLLLQSPALYYYIQVLPLFIVAIVIGISRRWRSALAISVIVVAISITLSIFGLNDAMRAERTAGIIDRNNHAAIMGAIDSIRSHEVTERPIVIAQNPAVAMLEHEKSVQLMTAHLVSFPTSSEPIADVLHKLNVQYVLLYVPHDGSVYSADYRALRSIADSLGEIILRRPGILFDVHRDYFAAGALNENLALDTLILYKLPAIAH